MRWLLAAFFGFSGFASAQEDTLYWQPDLMLHQPIRQDATLHFQFGIRYSEKTWRSVGTKHTHLVTEAYAIASQLSLLKSDPRSRELLQACFDIYEIEARSFQRVVNLPDIDLAVLSSEFEKRAAGKCTLLIEVFRKDSLVTQVRTDIEAELTQSRNNEPRPEAGSFSTDVYAGMHSGFLFGKIASYVPTFIAAGLGVDLNYRSFSLSVSHARGFAAITDTFVKQDFGFYPGQQVNYRQWMWQAGYRFFDFHKVSYSVFAGVQSIRFINNSQPEGSLLSRGPMSLNFCVSGEVSYSFPPFRHENNSETLLQLFARAGVHRFNYLYELSGGGITGLIGLRLHLRSLYFPDSDLN